MSFYVRVLAGLAGFAGAVLAGAALLLVRRDRTGVPVRVARLMGRLMCPAVGVRPVVRHAERLASSRPCVFVANHQSYLDYPILGTIYPERTIVLGQAILARIPVVSWVYRATGNVVVDRDDPSSGRAALEALAEAMRAGCSVWIFPEGTRNGEPGTLLPFRRGAFHLAASLGVPVVPIVVEPLRPRTDLRGRRLERRTVTVRVLPPVEPAGRSAEAIRDEVRARMEEALHAPPAATRPAPSRTSRPAARAAGGRSSGDARR